MGWCNQHESHSVLDGTNRDSFLYKFSFKHKQTFAASFICTHTEIFTAQHFWRSFSHCYTLIDMFAIACLEQLIKVEKIMNRSTEQWRNIIFFIFLQLFFYAKKFFFLNIPSLFFIYSFNFLSFNDFSFVFQCFRPLFFFLPEKKRNKFW